MAGPPKSERHIWLFQEDCEVIYDLLEGKQGLSTWVRDEIHEIVGQRKDGVKVSDAKRLDWEIQDYERRQREAVERLIDLETKAGYPGASDEYLKLIRQSAETIDRELLSQLMKDRLDLLLSRLPMGNKPFDLSDWLSDEPLSDEDIEAIKNHPDW